MHNCSYTEGKDGHTIQHRVVDESDVDAYACDNDKDSVQYHMEESIELDDSNLVISSSGTAVVHEVGDKVDPYWDEDVDGLDDTVKVPSMDGKSNYTLKLIHCSHDSERVRRTAHLSRHLKTRARADALLAKRDKGAV